MRLFTTVLTLLFSTSLLAIGPEDIELFGVAESGASVWLRFGGTDLETTNKGEAVYVGPKHYGYCWHAASQEVQGEYLFSCSPNIGGEPNLVYKMDKEGTKAASEFDEAAKATCSKYFARHKRNQGGCSGYYRCVKGCSGKYVSLFVHITHGD